MSSFNVNGPSNRPMIQESQNMQNNGGGGNLGYFQRGQKEEEFMPEEMVDAFEKEDTFEHEGAEPEEYNIFEKIINFIKNIFIKFVSFFMPQPEPKPEDGKDEFLKLSKK